MNLIESWVRDHRHAYEQDYGPVVNNKLLRKFNAIGQVRTDTNCRFAEAKAAIEAVFENGPDTSTRFIISISSEQRIILLNMLQRFHGMFTELERITLEDITK